MDIRNRMNDIVALRCHVCQAFLKMVLVPDWKEKLYREAQNAVERNSYKDNYIEAYNKMRDLGLGKYDVDCMDVSFISVIVFYCRGIAPAEKRTKDALKKLTEDRNTAGHSSENESAEELYLRALLAVSDIISFIKAVDLSESKISDSDRLQFRVKWMKESESLKNLLYDELIEYVQVSKEIAQDIKNIKESEDALATWCNIYEKYSKHYFNTERYNRFVVTASDEGIAFAHLYAANYFNFKKDFDELFRRLSLLCFSNIHLTKGDVSGILSELNNYLQLGNSETAQVKSIIEYLSKIGFNIFKNECGYYNL